MSVTNIKLQAVEFDRLKKEEKIHHLVRGKQMNELKIGDKIKFVCGKKARTRTIVGSEQVDIKNRAGHFPLITMKKGKEKLNLEQISSRNFASNNGDQGIVGLLVSLGLNEGSTAKCKLLHFTEFKYF